MQCQICDSASISSIGRFNGYDYVRCGRCGVTHYWPLMTATELDAHYAKEWSDPISPLAQYFDPVYEELNLERSFRPRLDWLAASGFKGRILDVGCSVGTFLEEAKARGWDVEGMDVAADACAATARALGCPVHQGVLETAELTPGAYDAIHASQVIEHVLDPAAFVAGARRALRPGGVLVLATPIIDPQVFFTTHWLQRLFVPLVSGNRVCPHPWALFPPFHVFTHSTRSLLMLLGKHGFRMIHTQKFVWNGWYKMNARWRAYYHVMNQVFRLLRSGQNIDVHAVRE